MTHAKNKKAERKKKKKTPTVELEQKLNLDHRNYGIWYVHPSKWEGRFQSLSDPKSIEIIKARNMAKAEKQKRFMIKEEIVMPKVSFFVAYNLYSPHILRSFFNQWKIQHFRLLL